MNQEQTTKKLSELISNPNNPRFIKDDKFHKLVQSIKDFPDMLKLRPIICNEQMIVLGGNMRLKACQELKIKEVPVIIVSGLTAEQEQEFIIKDNVSFGEWDWDILANEWDSEKLVDWGLEVPIFKDEDNISDSEKEIKNLWFLNIEFQSESEIQKWFEKLTEEGLYCKIVQ
jgi:ParB-like chromosome segregation protein Spo0J